MSATNPRLILDHVADNYRRYPGETLELFTRVQVIEDIPGYNLSIALPAGLEILSYIPTQQYVDLVPLVLYLEDGSRRVRWEVILPQSAGTVHEFRVKARIMPLNADRSLYSSAVLTLPTVEEESEVRVTANVSVLAQGKANYLHYLPALYESDDLMSRFLMFFESFWNPLEGQIDHIWYYLDPLVAPVDLLPWLASWLNLVLDERWPEAKRRRLLHAAVRLYRRRGTRQGLQEYLEIYTERIPRIVEHRAQNFKLGSETALGQGVALGQQNQPHTFTIILTLPAIQHEDPAEVQRQERARRRMIEEIIVTEKPAHAAYNLQLQIENGG